MFEDTPARQLDTKEKIVERFRAIDMEMDRLLRYGCPALEDMIAEGNMLMEMEDERRERVKDGHEDVLQEDLDHGRDGSHTRE